MDLVSGLHRGYYDAKFGNFVFDFVNVCLFDQTPPRRLVAGCLLLVGLLISLQIDQRHLSKLDKR